MNVNLKPRHVFGLRCEAMILLGVIWIVFGLGVKTGMSSPPNGLLLMSIPSAIRAHIWIITGALAIISGILSRRTTLALTGLMIMPLIRFISYIHGWAMTLIPGHQGAEMPSGWFIAAMYAAMVIFVYIVANIPPGMSRIPRSPDHERKPCRG